MPFFHPNQSKQQLYQYLNRRKSSSQNSGTMNDFFLRTKYESRKQLRKSKRFNTTQAQEFQIDFRIMTVFQPSDDYKFTGECFKTKYKSKGSLHVVNLENEEDEIQTVIKQANHTQGYDFIPKSLENSNIEPIDPNHPQNKFLSESFLLSKTQSPPQKIQKTKSSLKYQIKHPTPVKQAELLIRIKQSFLKRHNLVSKVKQKNLIKIEDYLTEQKDSFKRKMESELIRMGEAKLLSQIKERKGKIYLSGLHGVKKKRKQVENIDKLLVKSRQSFSTPNKLISHLKLASQKKQKLENINQLNEAKLQNFLQKIKSLNLKRDIMPVSIKSI